MPAPRRVLTHETARQHLWERCLTPSDQACVGLEAEWHVARVGAPIACVPIAELEACVDGATLRGGSRITYEPGGQIELSTPPASDVSSACAALASDGATVATLLAAQRLVMLATGMDALRPPRRVLDAPRYRAMETYFDGFGPEGRWMMSRTAALQINVSNGSAADAERRWRLVHTIGPPLIAAFANSPARCGRATGWQSTRIGNWFAMDASRTASALRPCGRESWVDYVLDARVMLLRSGERYIPVARPLSFAGWIADGDAHGYPTPEDLDYHVTTLFPPVRARGWLEVRYLDALPEPSWRAAAAVVTALLEDSEAADTADRATRGLEHAWCAAARYGLSHPRLRAAATELFDAALDALPRVRADGTTAAACHDFADLYTRRGRSPADDVLDALRSGKEPQWI
jgi:glutamate--cysteine ligase